MAKTAYITITYDEVTRKLETLVNLAGVVPALPDQEIDVTQTETITLMKTPVLRQTDVQAFTRSLGMALISANLQLEQWASAVITIDKSNALIGASADPVEVFDAFLDTNL